MTILTSTSSYTLVQILTRNANLGDWSWKVWTEKNVVVRLKALFTVYLRVCKLFFWVESGKMLLKCTSALHERKIFFGALAHGRHNNENVASFHLISSLSNALRLNAKTTSRTSSISSWLSQVTTNSVWWGEPNSWVADSLFKITCWLSPTVVCNNSHRSPTINTETFEYISGCSVQHVQLPVCHPVSKEQERRDQRHSEWM